MRLVALGLVLALIGCGGSSSRPNALNGASDARAIRIVDREEQGAWIPLAPAQLDELRGIAGGLGEWPDYKCVFDPGIGVAFTRPDGTEGRMEICFSCGEVRIEGGGNDDQLYLEPIRPRVVAWARAVFPDDPELQALR